MSESLLSTAPSVIGSLFSALADLFKFHSSKDATRNSGPYRSCLSSHPSAAHYSAQIRSLISLNDPSKLSACEKILKRFKEEFGEEDPLYQNSVLLTFGQMAAFQRSVNAPHASLRCLKKAADLEEMKGGVREGGRGENLILAAGTRLNNGAVLSDIKRHPQALQEYSLVLELLVLASTDKYFFLHPAHLQQIVELSILSLRGLGIEFEFLRQAYSTSWAYGLAFHIATVFGRIGGVSSEVKEEADLACRDVLTSYGLDPPTEAKNFRRTHGIRSLDSEERSRSPSPLVGDRRGFGGGRKRKEEVRGSLEAVAMPYNSKRSEEEQSISSGFKSDSSKKEESSADSEEEEEGMLEGGASRLLEFFLVRHFGSIRLAFEAMRDKTSERIRETNFVSTLSRKSTFLDISEIADIYHFLDKKGRGVVPLDRLVAFCERQRKAWFDSCPESFLKIVEKLRGNLIKEFGSVLDGLRSGDLNGDQRLSLEEWKLAWGHSWRMGEGDGPEQVFDMVNDISGLTLSGLPPEEMELDLNVLELILSHHVSNF